MRLGIGLDNVLCDTESAWQPWVKRLGIPAESWRDRRLHREEQFWASLKPFNDVLLLAQEKGELFILTERPPSLYPVTKNWLRIYGLTPIDIIFSTVKRFDARLLRLDVFVDTDPEVLIPFGPEGTQAVLLDREGLHGDDPNFIKINSLEKVWSIKNEKMHVPWAIHKLRAGDI